MIYNGVINLNEREFMKAKLIRVESAKGRGNESENWGDEVRAIDAYFVRDDGKKYILHFLETRVCSAELERDGVRYKLDAYTQIGFRKRVRLGALRADMVAQVRAELGA